MSLTNDRLVSLTVAPSWLLFASSVAFVMATDRWYRKRSLLRSICNNSSQKQENNNDAYYLRRAHQLRMALSKPVQSRFRVVALLLLENGQEIYGANDEASPTISGSICAERGALLQYRLQQFGSNKEYNNPNTAMWPKIVRIYIVTDSETPVPPGLLCREYMFGHPAIASSSTGIVMQSADTSSKPWISNLQSLYPHPSPYMKLTVEEQIEKGTAWKRSGKLWEIKEQVAKDTLPFTAAHVQQVLRAAQQAAEDDCRDVVHPIRYGAALLLIKKDSLHNPVVIQAAQRKALEYGATQDAVAQCMSLLFNSMNNSSSSIKFAADAILLAQVDQFGMIHPPFAAARSILMEHGWGDIIHVVVPSGRDDTNQIDLVPASVLAPHVPVWK